MTTVELWRTASAYGDFAASHSLVGQPLFAFVAGAALGGLFFGGLWWTLQRLPQSSHPALLLVGGAVARAVLVVAGVFLATGGEALAVAVCMAGFLAARLTLTRALGPAQSPTRSTD